MKKRNGIIARGLQPFTAFCFDKALWVIFATLVFLGFMISQSIKIPIDTSTEGVLRKDDPARVAYNLFKNTFGRDDLIILSLPIQGEMDDAFFTRLHALQTRIENEVPFVDEVTSLINARVTKGENDELLVEDLLEGWSPGSTDAPLDGEALKAYVLGQPHYVDRLISRDGKFTALIVEQTIFGNSKDSDGKPQFLDSLESKQTVDALKKIVSENPDLGIALGGKPVVLNIVNIKTTIDSATSGTAAIILSMLFMAFFFRRWSGVLLPLLVIVGSMVGAMGFMGIFKAPFTLTIGSIFPLMVAVGVADAVHILSRFYKNYEDLGDKRQAIIQAISESGPAVLLTSLTTAIGFLSFIAGDLTSTADLGIYASIAVLLALFFTIALLPAFISVFNIKRLTGNGNLNLTLNRFLERCGDLACNYPRLVSCSGITLLLTCLWGITFLHFYYNPISRFPDTTVEKVDNTMLDNQYHGIQGIEVVIDSGEPRGLLKGNLLEKLELAAGTLSHTTRNNMPLEDSYSVLNILKETHRALNNNDEAFYKISENKALIAQELLLFEMNNADDLRDVVDDDLQSFRLTLNTREADGVEYAALIKILQKELDEIFGDEATITITGNTALMAASVPKALMTMAKSYVIAIVLIVLLMMVMVRSVKIGLISIVPNTLPILMVMNVMVIMGWPLDMTTILVGAIAMGIVVDDTLHFLYHFKDDFQRHLDAKMAVRHTLKMTGPALFITTIIFSTGAGSNMLSSIENIFIFGLTMWLVSVLALLADIIVTPALLVWAYKAKEPVARTCEA